MRKSNVKHLIIPDTQVKPGVNTDHIEALGNYIIEKQPDVIVCLGDWWDMPSLSSYDVGKIKHEGARYEDDIKAGQDAMERLFKPIAQLNRKLAKQHLKQYRPRMVFLMGNHEYRIARAYETDPKMEGKISLDDLGLKNWPWEVYDFLEVVEIDGIHYSHYFYNPNTGRPWGGKAHTKLNNIGFTFTMGHQQGKDQAEKHLANGTTLRGLIVGSFYSHFEDYRGPQANTHFQGIIMKHEVKDGTYNLMEVSLDYLLEEYL